MKQKWPKPDVDFIIPLYSGCLYLFKTPKKWNDAMEYLGAPMKDDALSGVCRHLTSKETGKSIYVVGWYNGEKSTLCHELSHATFFILENAGIDARDSHGETFCYLLTDLLYRCGVDK